MKILKTGQYKRAQPLQEQFVKASFSNFFFLSFFHFFFVFKFKEYCQTRREKSDIQNHWGTNVMGSISALVIRSDIKEQIPEPEDIDRYKINLISHKSRKSRKKQIRK